MDGFPGNMSTPTSVAPPPNLGLSDAAAAQKQFFEVSACYCLVSFKFFIYIKLCGLNLLLH